MIEFRPEPEASDELEDAALCWPRQATNAAIVRAGGLLLILKDDAELVVAKASPIGFEPVKRYTVADSATSAEPVISGKDAERVDYEDYH